MSYTPEVVAELEILCLFNLDNSLEGLKVHHDAGLPPTPFQSAPLRTN